MKKNTVRKRKQEEVSAATLEKRHSYGCRLFLLRDAKGLSQVQLAKASRVSQATVCSFENASNDITLSRVLRILEVLGITEGEFFDQKELKKAVKKCKEIAKTAVDSDANQKPQ